MNDQELRDLVATLAQQTIANTQAIARLTAALEVDRQLTAELREGQAMLGGFQADVRQDIVDLRYATNRSLDRLDQSLRENTLAMRDLLEELLVHREVSLGSL